MSDISEPISFPLGTTDSVKLEGAVPAPAAKTVVARGPVNSDLVEQFSQRLKDGDGQSFEIELNPRELGRVTFQMRNTADGLTVQILAERSDTQELVRRHIEELARELRSLGHSSIAFAFGDAKQQAGDAWKQRLGAASTMLGALEADEAHAIKPQAKAGQTGIDLRI